ncbi:MAG: crossover junction endodeoxyribonuclease RuvC [Bacteroidia bacterium]|nr:crossover junction endodeoxyribonuclease RuvC [Bacteroidia bacterium]
MVKYWIGIDIGSQEVGVACVEAEHRAMRLLRCEPLKLRRTSLEERMQSLYAWLAELFRSYEGKVSQVALEEPFVGKNIRSALLLGTIKGLVWGTLLSQGYPSPLLISPAQVKKAITGNPYASKEQVARMLSHHLGGDVVLPDSEHATDALAIALTAYYYQNSPISRTFSKRAER